MRQQLLEHARRSRSHFSSAQHTTAAVIRTALEHIPDTIPRCERIAGRGRTAENLSAVE